MAFQRGAGKSHKTHTSKSTKDTRTTAERLADLHFSLGHLRAALDANDGRYDRNILIANIARYEVQIAELTA